MKNPLDRMDRIENLVVDGMPDISYCIKGVDGWIEMKSPAAPKRKTTPVLKSQHKLLQSQKNWFKRQYNAGGIAYILICMRSRWILMDGAYADKVNDMTMIELINDSTWKAETPIFDGQWETLREALCKRH